MATASLGGIGVNPAGVAILGFGWLGQPLAAALHARGHALRVARRHLSAADTAQPFAVDSIDIGAAARHNWQAWAAYSTWVCLLPPSGSTDYVAGIAHWLKQAHVLGVRHILYSSSISVYGAASGMCDEYTPLQAQTDNARKVMAAEALFWNSGIEHVDILRLGGLYGGNRHPLFALQRQQSNRGGAQPVNMLAQTQAVATFCHAVQHPQQRRIRNIVMAQHPSKRAFYAAEAARLRVAAPVFEATDDDASAGKIVTSAYADFAAILHSSVKESSC